MGREVYRFEKIPTWVRVDTYIYFAKSIEVMIKENHIHVYNICISLAHLQAWKNN
jgi:hypothetical protein